MKLRLLRSAIDDLAEGRSFYDLQQPGLGDYFFDSVFSDIDSLELQAGIHPLHLTFHRALASRFPYAIYYRVQGEEVVIYRILDCRRDPRKIAAELTSGL
jgi:plasmid stabilization system protein ParE